MVEKDPALSRVRAGTDTERLDQDLFGLSDIHNNIKSLLQEARYNTNTGTELVEGYLNSELALLQQTIEGGDSTLVIDVPPNFSEHHPLSKLWAVFKPAQVQRNGTILHRFEIDPRSITAVQTQVLPTSYGEKAFEPKLWLRICNAPDPTSELEEREKSSSPGTWYPFYLDAVELRSSVQNPLPL